MDHDHWLEKPLDITDYADDLFDEELNLGWIRLFLGERSDYYNPRTYYKYKAANWGPYWYVSPESPFLYIASHRPHLKRVDFHVNHFGWYPENKKLGITEESWCHQYKDRRKALAWANGPWVAIPMLGLAYDQWKHWGVTESLQGEGL